MDISDDFRKAKDTLSRRLLLRGVRKGVIAAARTRHLASAIAAARYNVHAVGIGPKIVNGEPTSDLAICIHVTQKLAESLLLKRDRLPKDLDGIPTDVIESPPAFLLGAAACSVARRRMQRPLIAGISASHGDLAAGTISYFCRSTKPGDDPAQVFALSNSHIFAPINSALINDALFQPAPDDGGTSAASFAELHRFTRISLGTSAPNQVDAAIGRLLPGVQFSPQICSIGRILRAGVASTGLRVRKHGRTTAYTEGVVSDTAYDAVIGIDPRDPNLVARFQNQIRIDLVPGFPAFAADGDSGALIVHQTRAEAVGLLCAAPPGGGYAIANRIDQVVSALKIALL
jgi:hypothetical protein